MKKTQARYAPTMHPDYLELHFFDGTYRGVMFASAASAAAARMPGRAELDCSAVEQGFSLGAPIWSPPRASSTPSSTETLSRWSGQEPPRTRPVT